MPRILLIAVMSSASLASAALADEPSAAARPDRCHVGLQHVSLMSAAQMCPRPLATTVIARPPHISLRT